MNWLLTLYLLGLIASIIFVVRQLRYEPSVSGRWVVGILGVSMALIWPMTLLCLVLVWLVFLAEEAWSDHVARRDRP